MDCPGVQANPVSPVILNGEPGGTLKEVVVSIV
jgi:hypothetical protein